MLNFKQGNLCLLLFFISSLAFAEVVTDGSLGVATTVELNHSEFVIDAALGKTVGTNLFHSFSHFNLLQGESAVFTGAESIQNVISRVTGGKPSSIDGTLSCRVPNANLYLFNPAGVLFKEHAQLDLDGSLYVSTADYLKFADGSKVHADVVQSSVFSAAAPTAFGFLSDHPAAISKTRSVFQLNAGETLSFIGGDLWFDDSGLQTQASAVIGIKDGRLQLVSSAAQGVVPLHEAGDWSLAPSHFGKVSIQDDPATFAKRFIANLDVSGDGGGRIFIRAGDIDLGNLYVFADTQGKANGQGVLLQADGNIKLSNTRLTAEALSGSQGNGGTIELKGQHIDLQAGSYLDTTTSSVGQAGDIRLQAQDSIVIQGQSKAHETTVSARTVSTAKKVSGEGGNILISSDKLSIAGGIVSSQSVINGVAGNINIEVNDLALSDGAVVSVNLDGSNGRGGQLSVQANSSVMIEDNSFGRASALSSNVNGASSGGTAGQISVFTPLLQITNGGGIQSQSASQKGSAGGEIRLEVGALHLSNGIITAQSTGNGNAGNIDIQTAALQMDKQASITTQATAARGGNINFVSQGQVYLNNAEITGRAQGDKTVDSGGNVSLQTPDLMVLNNSRVIAAAKGGDGGNISVSAKSFVPSTDSLLDASSEKRVAGVIKINAPLEDAAEGLLAPTEKLLSQAVALQPCQISSQHSRLAVNVWQQETLLNAAEEAHYQELSKTYGEQGAQYQARGDYDQAQQATNTALFYAANGNPALDLVYRWLWQKARIYRDRGQTEQALVFYKKALLALVPFQLKMGDDYRQSVHNFATLIRPVYYELLELLLDQTEQETSTTRQQALLVSIRNYVEQLRLVEMRNYFRDPCILHEPNNRENLPQPVPQHRAVLYPIPLSTRLELLLALPDGIQRISVPIGQDALKEHAQQFRNHIQNVIHWRFLKPAANLYDWLIEPLQFHLERQRIQTLTVVADGFLRTIPFAPLFNKRTQQFLVEEETAVVVSPKYRYSTQTETAAGTEILLAGASKVKGYAPLPAVPEELNSIKQLVDKNANIQARVLLDDHFSLHNFQQMLENHPYRVVHLASHGEFNTDPALTYILANDKPITIEQLKTLIGVGRFRKQQLDLLTLSACETAVGDDRAALGLAGSAFKAGAHSALASLWSVNDEATAMLMRYFYQAWLDSPKALTKAQALQQAQRQLLEQKTFRHPVYWGAFLLVGEDS